MICCKNVVNVAPLYLFYFIYISCEEILCSHFSMSTPKKTFDLLHIIVGNLCNVQKLKNNDRY